MAKWMNPATVKVVLLPLVGVFGTLVAITWPTGHAAFCAGLQAVVS